MFFTMHDIDALGNTTDEFIKTGIKGIDSRIRGLRKGTVTNFVGLAGLRQIELYFAACA